MVEACIDVNEQDDLLFPLSAVSHYSFCPRRCALIHLERIWAENYFTASGKELHAVADDGGSESRKERRIARSLRLVSHELGINGISDIVEFRRDDERGVLVRRWPGRWVPYPVEYKWGTAKNEEPYRKQLCAQAMCLEEMFQTTIKEGALYLGTKKHRAAVRFDENLRTATRQTCREVKRLLVSGETPPPSFGKWCASCSLVEECRPKLVASRRSARAWLEKEMEIAKS